MKATLPQVPSQPRILLSTYLLIQQMSVKLIVSRLFFKKKKKKKHRRKKISASSFKLILMFMSMRTRGIFLKWKVNIS